MKKTFIALILTILTILCVGCSTEATNVNHNLNIQAEYFECARKITVYNARTDAIVLELEGFMNIDNNAYDELVITCKTGANTYKKNYVYLNRDTLYVIEDITDSVTDPYHYKMLIHTNILPSVEVRP